MKDNIIGYVYLILSFEPLNRSTIRSTLKEMIH